MAALFALGALSRMCPGRASATTAPVVPTLFPQDPRRRASASLYVQQGRFLPLEWHLAQIVALGSTRRQRDEQFVLTAVHGRRQRLLHQQVLLSASVFYSLLNFSQCSHPVHCWYFQFKHVRSMHTLLCWIFCCHIQCHFLHIL